MGGPENGNFPLLYVVKCPYVGGWVVQKSLKTPLRNIKMAPYTVNVLSAESTDECLRTKSKDN